MQNRPNIFLRLLRRERNLNINHPVPEDRPDPDQLQPLFNREENPRIIYNHDYTNSSQSFPSHRASRKVLLFSLMKSLLSKLLRLRYLSIIIILIVSLISFIICAAIPAFKLQNDHDDLRRNNEVYHGTTCDNLLQQVFSLLQQSLNAQIKPSAEKLNQIEWKIEKHCLGSSTEINPEIYFQMGFIYYRANMDQKALKWLNEIKEIISHTQKFYFPITSQTIIKTYFILTSLYIRRGNFAQSKVMIKKAEKQFIKYPSEPADDKTYLRSWLEELFGDLYAAEISSVTNPIEFEIFSAIIEKSYQEAIKDRLDLGNLRLAGIVQCSLAEFYIKRGLLDLAEQYNNEGIKNIQTYTEKIYTMAKCVRNDALIKLGRGQAKEAKIRFQEALGLLKEVLPRENDLTRSFQEEFKKLF